MNKTLLALLYFCCQIMFAQSIKVSYKQTFNFDYTNITPLYLYVDTKNNTSTLIRDFKSEASHRNQKEVPVADVYASIDRKFRMIIYSLI